MIEPNSRPTTELHSICGLMVSADPDRDLARLSRHGHGICPNRSIDWQRGRKEDVLQSLQVAHQRQRDLLFVVQHWPDEWSSVEVEELIVSHPLTRIICSFGPWCDGDGRTRQVWPEPLRVPFAWAPHRLCEECTVIRGEQPALPVTGSRDDVFQFERSSWWATPTTISPNRGVTVMIQTADSALKATWESICRTAGLSVALELDSSDLLLWDADPEIRRTGAHNLQQLRQRVGDIRQQYGQLPIVASVGFAREADVATLSAAGVDHVVSKLAPASCLIRSIVLASEQVAAA